jgi:membrane protein
VTSFLFALIYRVIPEVRVDWLDAATGSVLTALLFSVGKLLIGLYLGKAGIGSAYGAAGSLVVLLVWVYYSAQIFLFGAEFTYACAQLRRSRSSTLTGVSV